MVKAKAAKPRPTAAKPRPKTAKAKPKGESKPNSRSGPSGWKRWRDKRVDKPAPERKSKATQTVPEPSRRTSRLRLLGLAQPRRVAKLGRRRR